MRRGTRRATLVAALLSLCCASPAVAGELAVACEGTDVTDLIQEFLDSEGGRSGVFLSPGTCVVRGLVLKSDLEFLGAGRDETVLRLAGGSHTHVLQGTDVSNVTVAGLTIDANKAANDAGHGIRFANSSHLRLENLTILEPAGYGLGFQAGTAQHVVIEDVSIHRPGADGIDFKNPDSANRNIRLTSVHVDDPGTGKTGIDLRGERFRLQDISVAGVGPGEVGIRFRQNGEKWGVGGTRSTLTGFVVTGTGGIGVHVVNEDNRVREGWAEGVHVGVQITSTASTSARGNVVRNVTALDCRTAGFRTRRATNGRMLGGNRFSRCVSEGSLGDGMEITGHANRVDGCLLRGSAGIGLEITPGADSTVLLHNVLEDNATDYLDQGTNTRRQGK